MKALTQCRNRGDSQLVGLAMGDKAGLVMGSKVIDAKDNWDVAAPFPLPGGCGEANE